MVKMYNPVLTRPQLEKELSKLRKLNYNAFRWWRMYDVKSPKLHHRCPLIDRIKNGDFDYSHYKYQVEWCEHEMNDIWDKCRPDMQMFVEKTSLLRSRRKRLTDDFNKDEAEKLEVVIKAFVESFSCTKEQVYEEIDKCSGTLKDLYYIIESKYGYLFSTVPNIFKTSRRGRPAKIKI